MKKIKNVEVATVIARHVSLAVAVGTCAIRELRIVPGSQCTISDVRDMMSCEERSELRAYLLARGYAAIELDDGIMLVQS